MSISNKKKVDAPVSSAQLTSKRRATTRPITPPLIMPVLFLVAAAFCFVTSIVSAVPVQLYGLNYNTRQGPDWDWDKCKSRPQIVADLLLLRKLTNRIRVLSITDCGQGELVLSVCQELGMQLWLGLWVSEDEEVFEREKNALNSMLERGMIDSETVLGITVGSESIYREEVTVAENIALKNEIKQLVALDHGMPEMDIAIVDIGPTYKFNPQLSEAVDAIMLNNFPFWENINIDSSTDYILREINAVTTLPQAAGKKFVLGETGWPSDGFIQGVGTASPELQTQFFTQFYCRMDVELDWAYYYFTGIDNAWRQEQDKNNTIEGNWGFFLADLQLKPHFAELSFSCPQQPGVVYTFSELDLTIPTLPPVTSPPTTAALCSLHAGCEGLNGNCCPTDTGTYLGCCGAPPPPSPTGLPTTVKEPGTMSLPPTQSPTVHAPDLVTLPATTSPPTTSSPTTAPLTTSSPPTAALTTSLPTVTPVAEDEVIVTEIPASEDTQSPSGNISANTASSSSESGNSTTSNVTTTVNDTEMVASEAPSPSTTGETLFPVSEEKSMRPTVWFTEYPSATVPPNEIGITGTSRAPSAHTTMGLIMVVQLLWGVLSPF